MVLSELGRIVWDECFRTAEVRPNLQCYADEFVVTPNVMSGSIWTVDGPVGANRRVAPADDGPRGPARGSLGAIIAQYKSINRINAVRGTPGVSVWQRNSYGHITRTERALTAIRRYIVDNPRRRYMDRHSPAATGPGPEARHMWGPLQDHVRSPGGVPADDRDNMEGWP